MGDALIAGTGVGLSLDLDDILGRGVSVTRIHEPNRLLREHYDAQYRTFRRLFEHLADEFRQAAAVAIG